MPFCRAIMIRPSQQKVFLPGSFSHFRTTFFLATITDMAGPSLARQRPPHDRALLLLLRRPRARHHRGPAGQRWAGLSRRLRERERGERSVSTGAAAAPPRGAAAAVAMETPRPGGALP